MHKTEPVLTLAEVADLGGVHRNTVSRWLEDATDPLPSKRLGRGRVLVLPAELKRWAEGRGMMLLGDPFTVARPWPRAEGAAA